LPDACRTLTLLLLVHAALTAEPIRLHPSNPHYFEFRGKPTVLVTSGEHYGALINLDFDYSRYFDTLRKDRLNLTRVFTGAYREQPGAFQIAGNTLAPRPDRFISPWPRSETPGATDGGNKFDLSRWNDAYFIRLRNLMRRALRDGVVVELVLFCPYYEESMWQLSPLNAKNNVNRIGDVNRTDVLTLKDKNLVAVQLDLVRKIVSELRDFDNLYYEIANEPYFGGVTLEWQAHIAKTIAEAEAKFPARHLIAQNIANGSIKIESPSPQVSIFNFHYSRPPDSVKINYHLNKAIGNNETGFDGTADATYRIQGWEFLLAGGALYNNLDYSFTVGHENGTFSYPSTQPGGGGTALRRQLGILLDFLNRLDLVHMQPAPALIANALPAGISAQALQGEGQQFAIYLHTGQVRKDQKPRYVTGKEPIEVTLSLSLLAGRYRVRWLDPKTGSFSQRSTVRHNSGQLTVRSPSFNEDAALLIERQ
jgi:hypothetical protein